MRGMNEEAMRFARIEALLDAVLDLPEDERLPWLGQACAGDPALHADVLRLLDAMARSVGFLEHSDESDAGQDDLSGELLGPWRLLQPAGPGQFHGAMPCGAKESVHVRIVAGGGRQSRDFASQDGADLGYLL